MSALDATPVRICESNLRVKREKEYAYLLFLVRYRLNGTKPTIQLTW